MTQKPNNQILLYEADGGETRVEVLYEGETVWLNQKQMSDLFNTDQSGIARHIKNIYDTGELNQESTMQKLHNAHSSKPIQHYNLDMIISVGYRVNSYRGTQFRIWATQKLGEYVKKGFVMDDDRLANGGSNYFEELEERVRRIRNSEVNFYKKVRSVFATSIDYNKDAPEARTFFATVQNKFHYAITGHTAAELILDRVGSGKLNMGLTNWRRDNMTLKDAFIAKNYLGAIELKRLDLLVDQFLSYAQLQVVEQNAMYMVDWVKKLDQFIGELNEKPVLTNAGTVSRTEMERVVREEYEAYKSRMMRDQQLSELDWELRLQDAAENMLPPPEDEIDENGISREEYMEYLRKASKSNTPEQDIE